MRTVVLLLLAALGVVAAVGCKEHGKHRGAGRRNDDVFSDDESLAKTWDQEYDENSDFSEQEEEEEAETAESSPQASATYRVAQPHTNSRHYGSASHGHHGGYGAKSYSSVSLKPVTIAIVCTVMDPLEHIVWLQARCPDEYDRGNVIAKASVSLLPDLFSVSVSGEGGTVTSTLSINDPVAKGSGGVFRCEAWPHPGYGRHKRQLTPTLVGESRIGEEPGESRQGRAHQDPWNAIILGGAELIEECFYGSYEDKWRKLRALNDFAELSSKNLPVPRKNSNLRRLDHQPHEQYSDPYVSTDPKDAQFPFNEEDKNIPMESEQKNTFGLPPTAPPSTETHYKPILVSPTPATLLSQQPNQPNVKLYQTYDHQNKELNNKKSENQQPEILLSDLSNPEVRMQFLRNLSPEQIHHFQRSFDHNGDTTEEERVTTETPVQKVEVRTNMLPLQRALHSEARSTPTVRIPKSGLEVRTNMQPVDRYINSRMINFSVDNATQIS